MCKSVIKEEKSVSEPSVRLTFSTRSPGRSFMICLVFDVLQPSFDVIEMKF